MKILRRWPKYKKAQRRMAVMSKGELEDYIDNTMSEVVRTLSAYRIRRDGITSQEFRDTVFVLAVLGDELHKRKRNSPSDIL